MTPLRQRMLEDMGIRNLAENTQLSYLRQVSSFARHFQRSPEKLGPEEVRAYQVHLVEVRKLSPCSLHGKFALNDFRPWLRRLLRSWSCVSK